MVVKVTMLHEKSLPHSGGYHIDFFREKSKWEFHDTHYHYSIEFSNFEYFLSMSVAYPEAFRCWYTGLTTQNWCPN